jgi:hypothetical protein
LRADSTHCASTLEVDKIEGSSADFPQSPYQLGLWSR